MHELARLLDVSLEYVPDAQDRQALCPVAVWYFPPGHASHVDDPVDEKYVPAGQEMHAPEPTNPVPVLYVPNAQPGQIRCPEDAHASVPLSYVPTGHGPAGQGRTMAGTKVSPLKL